MRRSYFALSVTSLAVALATSLVSKPAVANDDWTVLTMAPDGSWGTATSFQTNRAIATAIANCKIMSQIEMGCGASFTVIQAGWSLGIRCGRENIIAAAKTLADAEQAAVNREHQLRRLYVPDMPSCRRLVTVDPQGKILTPSAQHSSRVGPKWITLGSYQDIDGLRDALDRGHMKIGTAANAILGSPGFTLNTTETEVNLVIASVADLGFGDEGTSLAAIYSRARALGLELCPAEVGPQLRLRYLSQPVGESLRVAMRPIVTDEGIAAGFTVANGGTGLLLLGGEVRPDSIIPAVTRFVFMRPQQPTMHTVGR
jgi:hypothetical protein